MSSTNNLSLRLPNPPTLIEHGRLKFLIMDAPTESVLPLYIKELEKNKVCHLVRVCHPTYNKEHLERLNIKVHDWPFDDGEAPPTGVIDRWLDLVNMTFPLVKKQAGIDETSSQDGECIATHCVAGLGRAPILVAIALIEDGMSWLDAVAYIRERRRGAINNKQLKFLETYKRRQRARGRCLLS